MNKPKITYSEKEDILHLVTSDEPESGSIELIPNIMVELNENGELIGFEILNASTSFRIHYFLIRTNKSERSVF